jgi:hypothetical protein
MKTITLTTVSQTAKLAFAESNTEPANTLESFMQTAFPFGCDTEG